MKKNAAKKIALLLIAVVSALVMGIMVAACAPKEATGTYKFVSMTMTEGGQTQTYEVGMKGPDGSTITDEYYVMELKEDGTVTYKAFGDTIDGTWTKDGNKVSVTMSGSTQEFTLDGNVLTLTTSFEGFSQTVKLKR